MYTVSATAVNSQEQMGLIFDIDVIKNYSVSQGSLQAQILMLLWTLLANLSLRKCSDQQRIA